MRRFGMSYANVMSTVAVVLAMSGTAVAATQISGSTLKDRSVSHKKLVLNTVTGAEVKESSLGRVPNADKLDGKDSSAFVQGSGVKIYQAKRTGLANDTNTNVSLLTVPGLGQLFVTCGGQTLAWLFSDTSGSIETVTAVAADVTTSPPAFFTQTLKPPVKTFADWQHDNQASDHAGFVDDISVVSQGSGHPVAHLHLTGATNVGASATCDAAVVATVQ